ncbi:3'-5' exonuclease [Oerskovia sp. M15]
MRRPGVGSRSTVLGATPCGTSWRPTVPRPPRPGRPTGTRRPSSLRVTSTRWRRRRCPDRRPCARGRGQDLSPSRLLFLRSLAEAGKNDLFLAEDSQQRIYGQKIVLSKYGINIRGRSRRLTLNYRTTAETLHYATRILDQQSVVDLDGAAASSDGYRSARTGPTPELVPCISLAEEYQRAARIVRGWIDAGDAPETIGLLVYTQAVAGKLQSGLADNGVEARFVSSEATVDKGRPVIMTMHRSKGMEFKRVLLFGLDSVPGLQRLSQLPEADRDDARLRERSLLYVAATRARDELVVMWKGEPSELLPEVA